MFIGHIEPKMKESSGEKGWHGLCNRVCVMNKKANRKGSVLMEYLVVLVFVGAALMITSARSFYSPVSGDDSGDPRINPKGFGEFGKKFVGFYQRTAGGLSLPVP